MKRIFKAFFASLLLGCLASAAGAQQSLPRLRFIMGKEGKLTAIPVLGTAAPIRIPEVGYASYTPSASYLQRLEIEQAEFRPETAALSAERPMDMNVLSGAYRAFFDEYAAMLKRVSPMALDFDEYEVYPVGAQSAFVLHGRQFTMPGAGGVTTAGAAIAWGNERLTLTGGAFAGRYFSPYATAPRFMGGANVSARYEVNDWMALRGWGQYMHSGDNGRDPFLQMNPLLEQTNVGGAVEFKVGDNGGFGVGINYQYNHFDRRMHPQYMVFPVFGGGNTRISVGSW